MTALRNATENDIPRITEIYAHYRADQRGHV